MIQLITKNSITQTSDTHKILFRWLHEIASAKEAKNALIWADLACVGEEYIGNGFKLRRI